MVHRESKFRDYLLLYFPLLGVFILDRLTKSLALNYLDSHSIPLIQGWLSLTLAFNKGIAFGLLANHGEIVVLLISIILLIGLLSVHSVPRRYYLPFGLVLGGAFGNVFDRFLSQSGVVDFISLAHFSVFNVADIAITIGIILLVISMFLAETKHVVRHSKQMRRRA